MPPSAHRPAWEERIRKDYEAFYSSLPGALPTPNSLLDSRFVQALMLSPKYMPEGAREAAQELFTSPVFITSAVLSMTLYLAALTCPEPLLSKGAVAAITLWLLVTYGATEVFGVALAVHQLYEEAQVARTLQQLEAAAERFGGLMGGVGLRIIATVVIGRFAGKLPEVPRNPGGGLWARLGTPKFSLAKSVTLQTSGYGSPGSGQQGFPHQPPGASPIGVPRGHLRVCRKISGTV